MIVTLQSSSSSGSRLAGMIEASLRLVTDAKLVHNCHCWLYSNTTHLEERVN